MTAGRSGNLVQGVNEGLAAALERDADVVLLGEDIGEYGGVFRATAGLRDRFGADRVIDMPLNEAGLVGTAIGMALYGKRPVCEIQFADYAYAGFDHLVNELARVRYRSGGELSCPVTIRMPVGGGIGGGPYQSQSPEAYFTHTPGLRVVCPATPQDAKGLLLASVASDDPVIFLEPKALYRRAAGPLPADPFEVPLGAARVARIGDDVTLVTWGGMVPVCLDAADRATSDGVDCEVIDLRTLAPLDVETISDAVTRSGRLVIVHEAPRTGGLGAEIAATLAERCFLHLEAPIQRVTGPDAPIALAHEDAYRPSAERVLAAITAALDY